ncbi:MAG: Rne/Rng family ribonuclease [Acidobacteria bacterium]|nr:Rne/Rng family ribonuclease [Acidobacteriota bacterium]
MTKELIISSTPFETKIAILEDDSLAEFYIERARQKSIVGNIYKGRVTKVLPGMQSAFVDIGLEKDAFLYVSDFAEAIEEYEKIFLREEKEEPRVKEEMERGVPPVTREMMRKKVPAEFREAPPPEGPSVTEPVVEAVQVEPEAVAEAAEVKKEEKIREILSEAAPVPDQVAAPPAPERVIPEAPQPAAPKQPAPPSVSWLEQVRQEQEKLRREKLERAGRGQPSGGSEDRGKTRGESEPGEETSGKSPDADRKASLRGDRNVEFFTATRHRPRKRPPQRRASRRPSKSSYQRQSIEDLLKEGQEILVQVAKEPISQKGARITSHIILPGRFLVFMPTVEHVGVSRKIASDEERARLRDIVNRNRNGIGGGFIVRTAGEGRSEADIAADIKFLAELWEDIRSRSERLSAPSLIHSELDLSQRVLRDQLSPDFNAIRLDDEEEYRRTVEFVSRFQPSLVNRVRLYTKDRPIFDEFGVTQELEKAMKPKVWLKSGGYIVVNQTEALVAIDVNTGKFVGKSDSLEDTITKTNLEAVREIVRQIRLRNLGGIIVIDFIDMEERRNQQRVLEAFNSELLKDKQTSKVLSFNEFGIVTVTRKRTKQSLERVLLQSCPHCNGSGMIKSTTTTCYTIYSEIKRMSQSFRGDEIIIRVHPEVAKALRSSESGVVTALEDLTRKEISIKSDPVLHLEQFDIVET